MFGVIPFPGKLILWPKSNEVKLEATLDENFGSNTCWMGEGGGGGGGGKPSLNVEGYWLDLMINSYSNNNS